MRYFKITLIFFLILESSFSQNSISINPAKTILREHNQLLSKNDMNSNRLADEGLKLYYNQKIFYNSNLLNLENQNGLMLMKGSGVFHSLLLEIKRKNISLSIEPELSNTNIYRNEKINKTGIFSVLNDSPINKQTKLTHFKNMNISANYKSVEFGLTNKNFWWGPSIHNSITMSNNSRGFYHLFFKANNSFLTNDFKWSIKYLTSLKMINNNKNNFYLSAVFYSFAFKKLEIGYSRNILSGGYDDDIAWNFKQASTVYFSNKNMKYWDQLYNFYISYKSKDSNLITFLEVGYPNRSFNGENPQAYFDHSLSSVIGLRKYRAFNSNKIMIGFEYSRLLQSIYYNILPSSNLYDNNKYDYSSYEGFRWAAHSGSDSDDFLVFFGIISNQNSIIYGLNYERHGVTYHFPPEVKFESRLSITFKVNKMFFKLNYENELFEHYGFIDSNTNVWEENFEEGSIQRTYTLLFTLEYLLN